MQIEPRPREKRKMDESEIEEPDSKVVKQQLKYLKYKMKYLKLKALLKL